MGQISHLSGSGLAQEGLQYKGTISMDQSMRKSQLIDKIKHSRAEWQVLISPLDDAQMVQARVIEGWSLKDIIAHITWYEREMVQVLQNKTLVGSELWDLPTDERNQVIFEANQNRALNDIREEAQQVYGHLVELLEGLEEEDLHDPSRFDQMPKDWQPWEVIGSNTYEHYPDHVAQVRNWLGE